MIKVLIKSWKKRLCSLRVNKLGFTLYKEIFDLKDNCKAGATVKAMDKIDKIKDKI